jgi:hypothetical protein
MKPKLIGTKRYLIHWEGQPQPGAETFSNRRVALLEALQMRQPNEAFSIVEVGERGWPHQFKTVYLDNGGPRGDWGYV